MPVMIGDLRYMKYHFPEVFGREDVLRRIAKQVLLGIEYIHDKGYIHHGTHSTRLSSSRQVSTSSYSDIKLDNVLFELDDMEEIIRHHLATMRPYHYEPYKNKEGLTINYVSSTPVKCPVLTEESVAKFNIRIADFGLCEPAIECYEVHNANVVT